MSTNPYRPPLSPSTELIESREPVIPDDDELSGLLKVVRLIGVSGGILGVIIMLVALAASVMG